MFQGIDANGNPICLSASGTWCGAAGIGGNFYGDGIHFALTVENESITPCNGQAILQDAFYYQDLNRVWHPSVPPAYLDLNGFWHFSSNFNQMLTCPDGFSLYQIPLANFVDLSTYRAIPDDNAFNVTGGRGPLYTCQKN
jgi:hypothetical protein